MMSVTGVLFRTCALELGLLLLKSLLKLFILFFLLLLNFLFYKLLLMILLLLVLFIVNCRDILLTQISRFQYFLSIILHNIFEHILKINKPSVLFVLVHLLSADKTHAVYIKLLDYCAMAVNKVRHQRLKLLLFVNEGLWLRLLVWVLVFIVLNLYVILGELLLVIFLIFLFNNFNLLQSLTLFLYYVLILSFLF